MGNIAIAKSFPSEKIWLLFIVFQECIEYYGARRGMQICKDHYDDFLECSLKHKQVPKYWVKQCVTTLRMCVYCIWVKQYFFIISASIFL